MKRIKLLISIAVFISCCCNTYAQSFDYEGLIDRIQDDLYRYSSGGTTTVNDWIADQNADGSWDDWAYGSGIPSSSNGHLGRIEAIANRVTNPLHENYGDTTWINSIKAGMHFWTYSNTESVNWYNVHISWAVKVVQITTLMREFPGVMEPGALGITEDEIFTVLVDDAISTLDKWDDGSNMMYVGYVYVLRGILQEDSTQIVAVRDYLEARLLNHVKSDLSFHEHGAQLHFGAYGLAQSKLVVELAYYLVGSPAEFDIVSGKFGTFLAFIRDAQLHSMRGDYWDFSVVGRGVARKNNVKGEMISTCEKLANLVDTANADIYNTYLERTNNHASYGVLPRNTNFWESDFSYHMRPDYYFSVKTSSVRTRKTEYGGNDENAKGGYLCLGANNIMVDGNEYYGLAAIWEWGMIPGVTNQYLPTTELPSLAHGQTVMGNTDFAGGVSNNNYGVVGFDNRKNGRTYKGWFMFDDAIVCLGAGVSFPAKADVRTTVDQCNAWDSVYYSLDGINELAVGNDTATISSDDFKYVRHGKVAYYFPDNDSVKFRLGPQSGTLKTVNLGYGSPDTITGDVFRLWKSHGDYPRQKQYAYIIVPGVESASEAQSVNVDSIDIVINDDSLQVVYHRELNIYQAIFYHAGNFNHNGVSIWVDKPCVLMLENDSLLSISDPKQWASEVLVEVVIDNDTLNNTIYLPTGGMKGSTFTLTIESLKVLSTSEKSISKVNVYPNPVTDRLTIDLGQKEKLAVVTIYSISGKKIFQKQYSNVSNINLNGQLLSSGINLLQVTTAFEEFSFQLIKE
ncbi:MAG: T9SS type A sorting domain-containing protein [Flavobacteriales bacterium]|nr:T9SS type A sorting domain-containing protein [Flavobacteriales bacterium]